MAKLLIILIAFPVIAYGQISTINFEKGVNKKTVKDWTTSLFKISTTSSTTYIRKQYAGEDKLHKNGHRDVVVWIPDSADLSEDFVAVLWLHGHRGYVPHRTFQDRTLKQLMPYAKPDSKFKNFVIIIPEMPWSIHTRTPTKRNSKLWMRPGDFARFIMQIEKILIAHVIDTMLKGSKSISGHKGFGKIDYRIVGHSAGGSAIKRIAITGDLCNLGPSMVVWSDASYGKWLDDAWEGCLKYSSIRVKIFVRKFGPPWKQATRFLEKFQMPPKNIELYVMKKPWTHKTIGNNVVKLSGILD